MGGSGSTHDDSEREERLGPIRPTLSEGDKRLRRIGQDLKNLEMRREDERYDRIGIGDAAVKMRNKRRQSDILRLANSRNNASYTDYYELPASVREDAEEELRKERKYKVQLANEIFKTDEYRYYEQLPEEVIESVEYYMQEHALPPVGKDPEDSEDSERDRWEKMAVELANQMFTPKKPYTRYDLLPPQVKRGVKLMLQS